MIKGKRLGMARNPLRRIGEQYPVWPVTVWDMDHTNAKMKAHKKAIGDEGVAREQSGTAGYKTTLGSSKNQVSIFNPNIMACLLKLYPPPPGGNIYDPFGGGGTRAIVCATQEEAYNYIGVEIRQEEIDAVIGRLTQLENKGYKHGSAQLVKSSSEHVPEVPDNWADILITCPPYYNMEKYQGGPLDLSMAPTYEDFLDGINDVINENHRILKPGALACWVVGLHRDEYGLIPIHHDLARLHAQGFTFVEEIVLHMKNTGSIQRVGNFAKGQHLLVRTHEYCLIFKKED